MEFSLAKVIFFIHLILVTNGLLFATTNGLPLQEVCRRCKDEKFCLYDFGSNSRTRFADYPLLGRIAIGTAQVLATHTQMKIHYSLLSATDPKLKGFLGLCENANATVIRSLAMILDDLDGGRYRDLRVHAKKTAEAGQYCESVFKSPYKSPVAGDDLKLNLLCDIIAIIADDLNAGKRV
ncbi:pectinesterase inhibitor-like [Primulina huaijiensis]|uniref:pectinesterase inhibitor-like n=1 Tax=Primulina huaijiensis TaxID=1492673 RepID=UPI003CC702A1